MQKRLFLSAVMPTDDATASCLGKPPDDTRRARATYIDYRQLPAWHIYTIDGRWFWAGIFIAVSAKRAMARSCARSYSRLGFHTPMLSADIRLILFFVHHRARLETYMVYAMISWLAKKFLFCCYYHGRYHHGRYWRYQAALKRYFYRLRAWYAHKYRQTAAPRRVADLLFIYIPPRKQWDDDTSSLVQRGLRFYRLPAPSRDGREATDEFRHAAPDVGHLIGSVIFRYDGTTRPRLKRNKVITGRRHFANIGASSDEFR